jgi:hypothetical protein
MTISKGLWTWYCILRAAGYSGDAVAVGVAVVEGAGVLRGRALFGVRNWTVDLGERDRTHYCATACNLRLTKVIQLADGGGDGHLAPFVEQSLGVTLGGWRSTVTFARGRHNRSCARRAGGRAAGLAYIV